MAMKNILTLTDYSTIAENAVEASFVFSKNYNTQLYIYHNTNDGEVTEYNLTNSIPLSVNSLEDKSEAPITNWKSLADKHKVDATLLQGTGDLLKNVAAIIVKYNIDLVIMGSTGAGGKQEYIWGTNTEKVINEIDCPVLVVKRPMNDYRIDEIVFASSFDSNERESFKMAMNLLAPPKDATIHLLSVDTLSYFTQPTIVIKQAMKKFESLAAPYKVKSHFYKDYSIDAGIRHFLEDIKPDLLIMSNRNTNPIKKFIKGSNTIRAVHHADFPVLTIDYK